MSYGRCGYTDDFDDTLQLGRWRAQVKSAINGRRGQKFLRDLIEALDVMPVKELIRDDLQKDGGVCAIGAVGVKRNIDLTLIHPDQHQILAMQFNIAYQLVQEVEYVNDEAFVGNVEDTGARRWQRVRDWAAKNLKEQQA